MNQQLALVGDNNPPAEQTPSESKAVAFFGKFDLVALKKANAELLFDYETKKGREEARSHIYKLRQSKAAIEKAGKAERADSIAYQKAVIVEEDKLVAEVVEMIEVHAKPLEEWEEKEAKRVETIRARIDGMKVTAEYLAGKTSAELKTRLSELATLVTGEGFDEFADQAYAMKAVAIDQLQQAITAAEKAEADAAELLRLRHEAEMRRIADEKAAEEKRLEDERLSAEKAEADRKAQEAAEALAAEEKRKADEAAEAKRIAAAQKQAAEDARVAAEAEAAQREAKLLEEAENAKKAQKEAEDKAEAERIAAQVAATAAAEKAKRDQESAVAAEAKRIADEKAAQKAIDDARAADREHRAKINRETLEVLTQILNATFDDKNVDTADGMAKAIITAVALVKIPHLQINY